MCIMRVSTIRAACRRGHRIDLSFLEPENQGLRSRLSRRAVIRNFLGRRRTPGELLKRKSEERETRDVFRGLQLEGKRI